MSDQITLSAASSAALAPLGNVVLARDHGLSHAGDISTPDVLRTIHLTVRYDTFPGVGTVALGHHLRVVFFFIIFVLLSAFLCLLLSLLGPILELLPALGFPLTLQIFFMLHLLE